VVVKSVPVSDFKAKCLGLIDPGSEDRTASADHATRSAVAVVIPADPARKRRFLDDMIGTGEIVSDIVSPIIDLEEIEARD
jgi:hypothetical protein